MKSRANHPAFTIIELLIAVGILSMVMVAIYASWSSILRGTKVGLEAAAMAQRSRMAMRAIEDALLTVEMFSANVRYYSFIADTASSDFSALSFVSRLPTSFPGSGMFGDQVVRRVTFFVEPGPDSKNQLVMTQMPLLLQTNADVQPYPIVLARDVRFFGLEFWNVRLNEWDTEFIYTNQLPRLMRITLGLGFNSESSRTPVEVVTRVVAIPSNIVLPEMQSPNPQALGANSGMGGAGGFNPADVVQTLPDGTRVLKDGSRVMGDGSRQLPNGTVIPPGGTGRRITPGGPGGAPLIIPQPQGGKR